jgi:putative transposase
MFCKLFGYSKQAYYKQHNRNQDRSEKQIQAKALVLSVRRQMPRLGTRKLYYLLKDNFKRNAIPMGRDKLFSLLRDQGLLVSKKKRYTKTTESRHWMKKYPNLIKDICLIRPEQVWVADITYIDTLENGTAYLHLITDAYSKQIMGYELCNNMEAASTLKALQMALNNRKYCQMPLIHHSDRGLQYCSKLYTDYLIMHGLQISMTENGDPYENATAERINGILKQEFNLSDIHQNINEAIIQTSQSIGIYNNLRPHLSCRMLTPIQMHEQQSITVKTWKRKISNTLMDV